jgi:hypothetical protein
MDQSSKKKCENLTSTPPKPPTHTHELADLTEWTPPKLRSLTTARNTALTKGAGVDGTSSYS